MKCIRKVSRLESFVKGYEPGDWWIGIDVHKRSYAIALRRSDAQIHTWTSPADPQGFIEQLSRLGIHPCGVAQEAGPTGFDLARALTRAGIRAIVAAPSRIPRPVLADAKSDRLDCRRLAEYAARGMLNCIAVPTEEEEAFRALVRRRQAVTDQIRRCKQRIKALFLYHDLPAAPEIASWSADALDRVANWPLPAELRAVCDSLLDELSAHTANQRGIDQRLEECLSRQTVWHAQLQALCTVPGVGPRVAQTFLAEVFRPERFDSAGEVTSYLGLAPMVHHSGESAPRGRIRPVGQQRLRSLLVEAAWVWKARDAGAQDLYARLLGRMGISQKAIVALARRLTEILWRIAMEQRPYYPMKSYES
ncbi:MAG: IS110 family transposase [Bacteroidota bacterium]